MGDDIKETWHTQWGELFMQSERGIHDRRSIHYAQWHTSARRRHEAPPFAENAMAGSHDKRRTSAAIQKWVDLNGGEVER